ncbi:hypothetical protein OH76DRAFT_1397698 [Lentinus brumalis]|uniref:Uncharacterized protein n=1 Tax=Lentinus brumalis TaxID=2498619 RepID=A0A371DPH4_9APHY|nr:hypothetical protein OH76DRAFT_1397698 [Polyporus brumalis]
MAPSRTLVDMSSASAMESAIREAENLRDALKVASAIHAHSMSDQQKVSVTPEFPLELAGVLVDITRDAVTLHLGSESEGGSNNTALDFADLREKFACSLRKVLADMMVLQGTDDKSLYKLVTTSDHFVLELVQTMSSIIKSNVSALGEDRSSARLPPTQLNMLTPRIVYYLVHSLRCAAETHVTRTRDLTSCKEALLAAQEEAMTIRREAQHRLEEQCALHRSALEKLEAQLAQATEEAAAAQGEIVRLHSELLSQKAAHATDTQEQARVHADVAVALQAEVVLERSKVIAAVQEQEVSRRGTRNWK